MENKDFLLREGIPEAPIIELPFINNEEDDYNLMPLTELQKFIDLNHHLPNIKSAAEYEVHGSMALKELNIKLLENVEELTLYTLEQEAEIEKLKKQMKAMQLLLEKMINK